MSPSGVAFGSVEEVGVVLGEVAGARLVAPASLAGVGAEALDGDLEQRRLAEPVRAEDGDLLAAADDERHALQHALLAVGLGDPGELEDVLAARALDRELEERRRAAALGELLDLDLLDLLEAALRLLRLRRLRAEAIDEGALVGDDLLRAGDLRLLALAGGALLHRERGVAARVELDGAVVDVEDVRGDRLEEALVVGDDERAAVVVGEEGLEPADREDVEVVRRLVEQEHVGARDEDLREQDAQLEAAGERRERLLLDGERDAEALEDGRGARLERVAVVRAEDVLDVREAARVGAVVDDAVLLAERLPDDGVALHREVEDGRAVVEEAVLAEDAEPRLARDRDAAAGRRLVPGEDLEERGLARSRSRRRARSATPRSAGGTRSRTACVRRTTFPGGRGQSWRPS